MKTHTFKLTHENLGMSLFYRIRVKPRNDEFKKNVEVWNEKAIKLNVDHFVGDKTTQMLLEIEAQGDNPEAIGNVLIHYHPGLVIEQLPSIDTEETE